MYKIRDFRIKLKQAFDAAEAGEEVLIDRDGTVFYLACADHKPLPVKMKLPGKKLPVPPAGNLCVHFAARGFCKLTKCPHSMFNKKNLGA